MWKMKMGNLKKWGIVLGLMMGVAGGVTPAQAYVDNACIMGGFNADGSMYMWDYLNENNYRFYNKKGSEDYYIKKDNSVFMDISNGGWSLEPLEAGKMRLIIFLKPGPKTDKGIQVGDNLKKLVNTYGSVYKTDRSDIYENDPQTGYYQGLDGRGYLASVGKVSIRYFIVTYFDRDKHRLNFILDRYSGRILAILYITGGHNPYYSGNVGSYMTGAGLWRFVI